MQHSRVFLWLFTPFRSLLLGKLSKALSLLMGAYLLASGWLYGAGLVLPQTPSSLISSTMLALLLPPVWLLLWVCNCKRSASVLAVSLLIWPLVIGYV